jgi:hypothetical protein
MTAKTIGAFCAIMAAWLFACGGNSAPPPPPEQAGQACTAPAQCYPGIDGGALMGGGAVCMDRVPGGYCTHFCNVDTDCCALAGECKTSHPQVCSPFESATAKYCFLSCEDKIVTDFGQTNADTFCATFAYTGFKCRSSGGGSQNRKVCTP